MNEPATPIDHSPLIERLSEKKKGVMQFVDALAEKRGRFYRLHRYYHRRILHFIKYCIPEGKKVVELACGTGNLLAGLKPSKGIGIDISNEMVQRANSLHPGCDFIHDDAETFKLDEKFDYVVISDSIGYFEDIQHVLHQSRAVMHNESRIVLTFNNFLWQPFLTLAERWHLKMPQIMLNWLNLSDIRNLLHLEGFEVVKSGRRMLLPFYIPLLSAFFNNFLAHLPIFNFFCFYNYIIARPLGLETQKEFKVSVLVPARNEMGNIKEAVRRIPVMGAGTEVIFVEGGSSDDTLGELQRVCSGYNGPLELQWTVQEGIGKGDAVRKGFSIATGDIFMILDADLTVRPEDLRKFYRAFASGTGEYLNGSRLVYPMEKESMRYLNTLGNSFFASLFSWILKQPIKDTLCGTKVVSRKSWEAIQDGREYFGDFDPFGDFDMIFGASKLNLAFKEIPVRYQARTYGETNISRFSHGWLLLKMVFFALRKVKFR